MELNIGSNIIRNTNGVLIVDGKEQIILENGERDGQLLLSMDLYDSKGKHIAKLRRNAWIFSDDSLEFTTNPSALKLTHKENGEVVVEVSVQEKDKIQILNGKFYSSKGHLTEITPHFWRPASGFTMSGTVIDNCGAAIALG